MFFASQVRIDSTLPVATAQRRLANASKVLARTPWDTVYLTAKSSDARILVTVQGRNRRFFEFAGSVMPSAEGSCLVGAVRLSRISRVTVSAWFAAVLAGGIYFVHGVLTQPPDRDTPAFVAMLVVLGFVWAGFCGFAYLSFRRAFARGRDLIVEAMRTALSEAGT